MIRLFYISARLPSIAWYMIFPYNYCDKDLKCSSTFAVDLASYLFLIVIPPATRNKNVFNKNHEHKIRHSSTIKQWFNCIISRNKTKTMCAGMRVRTQPPDAIGGAIGADFTFVSDACLRACILGLLGKLVEGKLFFLN